MARLAQAHGGIIQRASAVWDGVVGDVIHKAPAGPHEVHISPAMNTLFLTRSTSPRTVIKKCGGRRDRVLSNAGGLLNLVAAGDTLVTVVPEGMPPMERLALAFLPEALERLEESRTRIELVSAVAIRECLERQLVDALAAELGNPRLHTRLYAESLAVSLMILLVRNHSSHSPRRPAARARGGLAPWQLRRVIDYLQEGIARDVSLAELATLVELSPSYFSRAFRASTGMPPHQYQLAARVEQAKHLLLGSTLSLDEIAAACGFSEQSHLSRAFRARVGASPGAWRRERRT